MRITIKATTHAALVEYAEPNVLFDVRTIRHPDGTFTIWLAEEVYDRLNRLKFPNETYDDLLLRMIDFHKEGRVQ